MQGQSTSIVSRVADIAKIAELAARHNLLLIVDNTFLTPYFQKPLSLGADIIIHSGTKFLGGHNDTLSGFLIAKTPELIEQIRFVSKTIGANLAPFDSWLITRGIKTLAVRMDKIEQNTRKIAEWLTTVSSVEKVIYTGFNSHPGYAVSVKQASGFGGIISFYVKDEETAIKILNGVKLIYFAESLGGTDSLITYPFLQTHADVPPEIREKKGINNRLLRLSVGIENAGDIIADLSRAIN